MTGLMTGLMTLLSIIVFFGIVWWAFSARRKSANKKAAMLPFDLPDEAEQSKPHPNDKQTKV